MFLNISVLQGSVVSTSPNPQAGGPPHVGCPRLRIQFIHIYPPYRRQFLYPQPEDAPCRGDSDPLHGSSDVSYSKFPRILRNLNVHSRENNGIIYFLYPEPHCFSPCPHIIFFQNTFYLILPSITGSSNFRPFLHVPQPRAHIYIYIYIFQFSATHATCTTHFIVVHLAGSTQVTVLPLTLKVVALNDASATHRPKL